MNSSSLLGSTGLSSMKALSQSKMTGLSNQFGGMLSAAKSGVGDVFDSAKSKLSSVKNAFDVASINPLEVIAQFSNDSPNPKKDENIKKAAQFVSDLKGVKDPDLIETKLIDITSDPGFIQIMKDINTNPTLQQKIKNTMESDKDFVETWIRSLSANLTDGNKDSFITLFGNAVNEIKTRPDAPPRAPFSAAPAGAGPRGDPNAAAPSITAGMDSAIATLNAGEQKDVNCGEMTKALVAAFGKILEPGSDLPERALLVDFIQNQIKEYEAKLIPAIANSLQVSAQSQQYFLKKLSKAMDMKKNIKVGGGSRKTRSKKKPSKKKRKTPTRRRK